MKWRILGSVLLVVLGGVLAFFLLPRGGGAGNGPIVIEKIQAMGFLVTTKLFTADVVEESLEGKVGSCTAVVIARGDVEVGVDMQQAKFESVDPQARSAVLLLPPPTSNSPRLDHDRTHVYDVKTTGAWQLVPHGDVERMAIDKAMSDGQHRVGACATEPSVLAASKRQAEQVLGSMFDQIGWKVAICWTNEPIRN